MLKEKKTIIFDLDGTLIDSLGMWNEVDSKLITEIGGMPHENVPQEREKYLRNNTYLDVYRGYAKYLCGRYNSSYTPEEIYNLSKKISKNYIEYLIELKHNADIFLRLCKQRKKLLGLATLTTHETLEIYKTKNKNIYSKCNFDQTFDSILGKEDVDQVKPKPDIYLKALNELKTNPEDAIVIEDSLSGTIAAKAAGIEVINIYDKYSDCDRKEINSLADFKVKDYNELIRRL